MYAAVADLRAEGVTTTMASDSRLEALLDEATRFIDRICGWYFEPRAAAYRVDGRGGRSIELPVPPLELRSVTVESTGFWSHAWEVGFTVRPQDLIVTGAPVGPDFDAPRMTLRYHHRFPRGERNVIVEGRWGYTEQDGTPDGTTPPTIRRACMLLVLRNLPLITDDAFHEARARGRLLEEQTRDQRYRLDNARMAGPLLVGDPDIDLLLSPYVRPIAVGSA